MPVLFVAHGNPMNAIVDSVFTRFLESWGRAFPVPKAILAVSAHWESAVPLVTSSPRPETIHDFYGFPDELFAVRYPAPGDPDLARRAVDLLGKAGRPARLDPRRGLDHGVWSPMRRLEPRASIPIVQLSLLHGEPMEEHLRMGAALAPLRDEGVLVLGSGNLVHNLGTADLARRDFLPEPWAVEFDAWVKERLDAGDPESLARFRERAPHGSFAHPTVEHFAPLLVVAGAARDGSSRVTHPFEGFEHGTISLRCVAFD